MIEKCINKLYNLLLLHVFQTFLHSEKNAKLWILMNQKRRRTSRYTL